MSLIINIIGAGKLGKTLARLIVDFKLARIGAVYNRSLHSSEKALNFIGEGNYYPTLAALPSANISFLTCPDEAIADLALALASQTQIRPGDIFVHCSGVLTSEILAPLKQHGALVASVHPMRSFAEPELAVKLYANTYCSIEGDALAVEALTSLFSGFGSIVYPIDKTKKALYHASGVFASNYLVTLAKQAHLCLKNSKVDEELAFDLILSLMQGTLANLKKTKSFKEALTGPLQRGDTSTLGLHLAAFDSVLQKKLYAALGQATLDLTSHDQAKILQLNECLLS